jgi:putative sterol carrier protein
MSSEVRDTINALPAAFLPEKARTARGLVQLDLTGDGGGKWLLEVAKGQCQVREGTTAQPDATLKMDAHDFVALFRNQLDPMRAFMGGKIKVSGNMGVVMQLMNWFERGA